MPFTLSHPAIVLPLIKLSKNKLSATGLIVGSMSPDFEYFLRLRLYGEYGHTFLGVWWFCLPTSLCLCFLFHVFLKHRVIANMPTVIQRHCGDILAVDWLKDTPHALWLIASIVIGAYSHILWDAFTHHNGFLLEELQLADTVIFDYPLYKLLQHASTMLGALVIFVVCLQYKPRQHITPTQPSNLFWCGVALIFACLLGMRVAINDGTDVFKLGHLVVNIIALGFYAVVIQVMLGKWFHQPKK